MQGLGAEIKPPPTQLSMVPIVPKGYLAIKPIVDTRNCTCACAPVSLVTVRLLNVDGIFIYNPSLGDELASIVLDGDALRGRSALTLFPLQYSGLRTQYPLCGVVFVKVLFSGLSIDGENDAVMSMVAAIPAVLTASSAMHASARNTE